MKKIPLERGKVESGPRTLRVDHPVRQTKTWVPATPETAEDGRGGTAWRSHEGASEAQRTPRKTRRFGKRNLPRDRERVRQHRYRGGKVSFGSGRDKQAAKRKQEQRLAARREEEEEEEEEERRREAQRQEEEEKRAAQRREEEIQAAREEATEAAKQQVLTSIMYREQVSRVSSSRTIESTWSLAALVAGTFGTC